MISYPNGSPSKYLGVSIVMGIPKNGWFIRDNPMERVLKKKGTTMGMFFCLTEAQR